MRRPLAQALVVAWLTALTALPARGLAAPPAEDPLDLAALLVQDGHIDRAAQVLDGLPPATRDAAPARFSTLRGLVLLRQGLPAEAAEAFERAIAATAPPVDPQLHLSLARARALAGEDQAALDALAAGGAPLRALPAAALIEARAQRALGRFAAAWGALERGAAASPDQPDFPRQQVLLLIEMGLTREAAERASALLEAGSGTADDALIFSEALRQAGALEPAMVVLEEARLRHPDQPRLDVRLAAVLVDAARPLAAARLLQRAAATDPSLADEAAELFRRAGQLEAALMMNAQVLDPTEKARQRFGLLLDAGAFDRAAALEDRLSRLALLDDDRVRYGLAYAWMQVGDLERADRLLGGISDPTVFQQATELRRAMQAEAP